MEMTGTFCRNPIEDPLLSWQAIRTRLPSRKASYSGFGIESSFGIITSNCTIISSFLGEYSSPILVRVAPHDAGVSISSSEPPVHAQVRSVLEYFGLSKSDLAKILGITRPTLYAWLDGHIEPKSENTRRLVALASIVEGTSNSMGKLSFMPTLNAQCPAFPWHLLKLLQPPPWMQP